MQPIWRKHLIICLFLWLLAIPIYFLDLASVRGGGGGNWITLDFRGRIFWTCVTALSVILLVTGFVVFGKFLRAQAIAG